MTTANLLNLETSPYLLQHAENPVHWYAWNNTSLALAKTKNRPILLSIGYSACHWCHVMAHESFEDASIARIMNQYFINIKVDKEERPDLDKIYQNAHSMLTERAGGWPLTVFLSPGDQMPIFAGTYFPSKQQYGLPSFEQLLMHMHDVWKNRKTDIEKQSTSLHEAYQRLHETPSFTSKTLSALPIDVSRNQIEQQFDSKSGGFSQAPKFPHSPIIERALHHWALAEHNKPSDPHILHTALHSLKKMCNGGIYDHLGGGFCRYSTDADWMIPHFEKMLYDNGPLLALYSQAWCISNKTYFYNTATETANWVIREMQSLEGGYYSAQDADSEGIEGKFFAWHIDEAKAVIDDECWPVFEQRFGFNKPANFEGKWHLHGYRSETELAKKLSIDIETVSNHLQLAKKQLYARREMRIHPARDEKMLCAWNGLMIHGMAAAGRLLNQPLYIESARRAAYFIKNNCWIKQRLYANYKAGRAQLNAYLDDYAFLLQGLLELLQCEWDASLYEWSLELADTLIEQFEDHQGGGFYFTGHDHEQLIQRTKSFGDDAIPSGNASACIALNQLGYISGRTHYIETVERCIKSAWQAINQAPISHCAMIDALSEYLNPPTILIIRSHKQDYTECTELTFYHYLPSILVFNIPAEQFIHSTLAAKEAQRDTCAYPCQGPQCYAIIKTVEEMRQLIKNNSYRI